MIARIPIRIRLSIAFVALVAIVLGASCLLIYTRLSAALDNTVNTGLRSRAEDLVALTRSAPSTLGTTNRARLLDPDESFAQIITPTGRIVDATPQLAHVTLLDPVQRHRALARPLFVDTGAVGNSDSSSRLLAVPAASPSGGLVVIVGTSLETRDEALSSLRTQLLIGGPIALLLVSVAGYWLAAAALAPVQRMQRRAAQIDSDQLDERLPLPAAHDEIRELGETLNTLLGQIEATVQRERRFIADASHELRTPLSLLRAELELAQWPGRTRGELETALRSAGDEADRLSQLAEDLLVLARADEGALPINIERLDAATLLADTALRFQTRAAGDERTIRVSADGQSLYGDRLRLEQAVGNLVDNALRYGEGDIHLRAASDDRGVQLTVSDNGPGFDPEFIDHAFERFTRADEARSSGGAGLGLAIVDVIAVAHQGSVHVANHTTHGAVVTLDLPNPPMADQDPPDA